MYARKAASEGIVYIYNAYEICFIKTSFTLIIVYHFLLQYFHLPFFLRSSRECFVELGLGLGPRLESAFTSRGGFPLQASCSAPSFPTPRPCRRCPHPPHPCPSLPNITTTFKPPPPLPSSSTRCSPSSPDALSTSQKPLDNKKNCEGATRRLHPPRLHPPRLPPSG